MNARTAEDQERLTEEAMDWVLQFQAGPVGPQERAAFDAWLAADPDRRALYARAERAWHGMAGLSALPEAHQALHGSGSRFSVTRRRRPMQLAAGAFAASLMMAAVLFGLLRNPAADVAAPLHYATPVAEIREIVLTDGTQLTLGARSKVEVRFTDTERRVILSDGEAFFAVQPDPTRPFFVRAEATEVRVVGTRFNVRLGTDVVEVAVEEGRVDVAAPATPGSRLMAGEQITTARPAAATPMPLTVAPRRAPAPSHVGAWRDGRLDYNNARLVDVIADARRYYPGRIDLQETSLGSLRVTTSFRADQVLSMLDSLEGTLPVSVNRRGDNVTLSSAPTTATR
ncbi:FecR domain-containing protein [Flagellatimonas centrodinii]|uniref:FecR family protein n=1 Tax=Flagellatimonas centrodinii TaxID=2806210 RepID=UPI001FF83AA3|nr:FecR domain-containing protein [Flagellatimonas centrodinii]ULQ46657.1 FecR domain-containing protein [Flagellatimonas centrodinii]